MIDPRAIVDADANIAADVEIGPFSIIGANVEIAEGTVIGPHVVVRGPAKIGKHNKIFQFASIGEECQDKKYAGEATTLTIGDHNIIREACTLHRGTVQDSGHTRVGSHNLLMVNTHIAHDAVIGNHCIFANDTNIAGHVHVGDWAILGGATQVHQFCKIGAHSMCGAGTVVLKDIPDYVMAIGYPASPHGINVEGLKRRAFSKEAIQALRAAYKTLYREGLTLEEAIEQLSTQTSPDNVLHGLIESLKQSSRGIIR